MKNIYFLFVYLLVFNSYAQKYELKFVLIGEVEMQECDEPGVVLFTSPILSHKIDSFAGRLELIKKTKENYKIYLSELVDLEFPQYYLKDCISEVENWAFFEEWSVKEENKLKDYIVEKYEGFKVIETDFRLTPDRQTSTDLEVVEQVDPNDALVEAFYLEAKNAFNTKDYSKTIKILNKAKELLEGKINLDVALLESKARIAYDKNINDAKAVLKSFMAKAARVNDDRIDEAASLLVKLETSDEYHHSGYKKIYERDTIINNLPILNVEFTNSDGSIYKINQLNKNQDNAIYREIDFNSKKGKRLLYFNKSNSIEKEEYFVKDKLNTVIFNEDQRVLYYNDSGKSQLVDYKNNKVNIKVFSKGFNDANNEYYLSLLNSEVLEIYKIQFDKLSTNFKINNIGMLKKVKVYAEKRGFFIYYFDKKGYPVFKKYFKKVGKLKDNYRFNFDTQSWDEI